MQFFPRLWMVISLIGPSVTISSQASVEAFRIARESLEHNIVETQVGPVLRAGANQFSGLWTRDFCYSIPGLLEIGRADVVKNHLQRLLEARRPSDHLVPRLLDNIPSRRRVLRGLFPWLGPVPTVDAPLRAEFLGEHGTEAIDSNLLVLRGLVQYVEHTGDRVFSMPLDRVFSQLLSYYQSHTRDDWIVQQAYGDWQDSVRRTGVTFLTNFHHWWVLHHATRLGLLDAEQEHEALRRETQLRDRLKEAFFDAQTGLFRSHLELSVVSLDGVALALLEPEFWKDAQEREGVYRALRSGVFARFPGRASDSDYPRRWRSLNVRAVGLGHYHDRLAWSWLIGLQGSAALAMGDRQEAERLRRFLSELLKRDGVVGEIYEPRRRYRLFRSLFYRSEAPFSWGAAWVLHFLGRPEWRASGPISNLTEL